MRAEGMDPELLKRRRKRMQKHARDLAKETGIPVAAILSRSRDAEVLVVRHRLWRRLREEEKFSFPVIGMIVGYDHSSIRAAIIKATQRDDDERGAA